MDEIDSCFVCQKHRGLVNVPGGPIYEDELVFSGHAWTVEQGETPYLGAMIVEPKRHVSSWGDLADDEAERIGIVIRDVSRALTEVMRAEHIYVFVLGHHVNHLHVWVIPRYPGTPREFWGFKILEWNDRPVGGSEEVNELCKQVRDAVTGLGSS